MSLLKYKKKRKFKETPEPKGKITKKKDELIFVVQKHSATRLHYDLRLELDGVLLSWAVPKGPSLDPKEKRLAMMVEDHPYDYKDFEGIIPKGNYGAGEVIVWDKGTYTSAETDDPKEVRSMLRSGLERGDLKFTLKGKKLKGKFVLVRLKNEDGNTWLLIKKDDKYVSTEDITLKDKSVISGKTIEQLERINPDEQKKNELKKKPLSKLKALKIPKKKRKQLSKS